MPEADQNHPPDKAGRNLIKAFTIAGGILGAGAFGLAKTVILFGEEAGWISNPLRLGSGYWWTAIGLGLGFFGSWWMVWARRRS
ncbi:MAG: hypothetical protein RLY20_2746 [Verrucomicrobiota bacterium]|jgi:hypothetical protein